MALLDAVAPYRWAAEAVVIGAVVAGCAYAFHEYSMGQQDIGYKRAKAEQATLDKVRDTAQAKLDAVLTQRVSDAESKANERDTTQKALNAAVGVSADRLQRAIDQVRAGSDTATVEALRASTATLATVFQDCAGQYRSLAKAADGHASDVQTLIDAWPVTPPQPQQEQSK
jgi:hypothetical protein